MTTRQMKFNNLGMSMFEILFGFVLFSFAMLPLLMFGQRSSRGAYSVGKHMMAGQIAAGLMDRCLALPYKDCLKTVEAFEKQGLTKVVDAPFIMDVIQHADLVATKKKIEEDLKRSFRSFKFTVSKVDGKGTEKGEVFRINVEVSWLINDSSEDTRHSIFLQALKFKESL